MKQKLRSVIISTIASITSVFILASFTGCTTTETNEIGEETSSTTISTSAITVTEPIIGEMIANTEEKSMLFTEWYDNPDVAASDVIDKSNLEDTGKTIINGLFKVYERIDDIDNTQYIVSGRTLIPLENGKLMRADLPLLRLENTGERVWVLEDSAIKNIELATSTDSPTTAPVRPTYDTSLTYAFDQEDLTPDTANVYFDNMLTSVKVVDDYVDIGKILLTFPNCASIYESTGVVVITIYPASGMREITVTDLGNGTANVSLGDDEFTAVETQVKMGNGNVASFLLDDIEPIFGYQLQIYNGNLNIVSDNKDLVIENSNLVPTTNADMYSSLDTIEDGDYVEDFEEVATDEVTIDNEVDASNDDTVEVIKNEVDTGNGDTEVVADEAVDEDNEVVADEVVAQEWTETELTQTMYVTQSCCSRDKALLNQNPVTWYTTGNQVNVVASTNTNYYKLDTGAYIHKDYVSLTMPVLPKETEPYIPYQQPVEETPSGGLPDWAAEKGWTMDDYLYWASAVEFGADPDTFDPTMEIGSDHGDKEIDITIISH